MLRILIILHGGERRRANGEASIVAGDFEPGKRFDAFLFYLVQDCFFTEEVEGITNGGFSSIRVREWKIFGMGLGFFFRHLEPVVTGDAGNQQFSLVLLCDGKVSDRKGEG
jgi:hypothetical protein